MELGETINMMQSSDYKERLKAEYHQTKIRYEKLKNFCNRIEASGMVDGVQEPNHDCPMYLLREQQKVMGEYLHIIELRAIIEKVEL